VVLSLAVVDALWSLVDGVLLAALLADALWSLVEGVLLAALLADALWSLVEGVLLAALLADALWSLVDGVLLAALLAEALWSLVAGVLLAALADELVALASDDGVAVAGCAYAGVLELPEAFALFAEALLLAFMSGLAEELAVPPAGVVLFWAEASVEVLPFALLLGEALAEELLGVADCMSLAEPVFEACGGFEVDGLLVLGLFGLLLVEPEVLVPEVPIAPEAPVPVELELAEVQWSETWRTSETWNELPPLVAEALVPPAVEVLAVALEPPPLPVTATCWPTYCCSLLVSPVRV
jgi:hypothetical protein